MSEPQYTPTSEREWERLPDLYRDGDALQAYPLGNKEVVEAFNRAIVPSFEKGAAGQTVYQNDCTNPSFETLAATTHQIFDGIVKNPLGRLKLASTVDVRTNYAVLGTITGDPQTTVQLGAIPAGNWSLATPGSDQGGQVRVPVPLQSLRNGSTYTFSIEVRNPAGNPASIGLSIAWGTSTPATEFTLAPGESKRVYSIGNESFYLNSNRMGFLSFDSDLKSIHFRNAMIENVGRALEYFDGSTASTDTDLASGWKGEPYGSFSVLTAPAIKGWSGTNAVVYWSAKRQGARMFVPFIGAATAHAESDGSVNIEPVTAMARKYTQNGQKWAVQYDGAYVNQVLTTPADDTFKELNYPVVGGTVPPEASRIGQYWVNDQNTAYVRIR